ncbi:MAG TPA: PASTA domain-containing protein [Streptosporangiaceae bacterium]|nr:PASTA domain-containing protein [Streptosporangiaceae bacterium]
MDTTLSRLHAGQLLDGRYRVGSWIARGGMATIYLGTDTKLDRTVALKVAHAELAGDPEFVRRFIGEARSVARLSSPNVVAVFDQSSDGDLLYLVMEYVPGRTLRELLRERGRLGPREALDVISGVLAGLAAAHQAGIIHRDVKPENVLLGDGDTVKVADFGLARAASQASHTKTGMIIGTAAYLAPEQVARSMSDARTDVYAAGVMLFEMLTGTQPHTGENPLAVAHKHVSDVVPAPSSVVADLPPSLDALVAMATSRDPDLRPGDAGQFLRAISDVRRGMPIGPPDPAAAGAAFPWSEQDGQTAALGYGPGQQGGYGPDQGSGYGGYAPDQHGGYGQVPPSSYSPMPGSGYSPVPGGDYGQPPAQDAMNHTLVVPGAGLPADGIPYGGLPYGDDDGPQTGHRRGYRRRAEPVLQRWLFSRRFVYAALTLGVAVIVGLIFWWVTDGQFVTVPQVRQMAASTAQTELQNLGFTVRLGPSQHNSGIAKGDVIKTDPATGSSAKRGAVVTLIVSTGPVMINVPQVTGLTQAAAESALKKNGLKPGQVSTAASATIGAGVVISTDPVAGTSWPQNKPVGLTVSAGPPLPNFVGQQFQAAVGTAQQGGYQLQEQANANSDQPAGTITGQQPAAGTPITQGEVVTVQVSTGPPEVTIPSVTGDTSDQATAALEAAGFQVTGSGLGRVVGTNPSGQAPKGSTITLILTIPFP